MSAIAAGALYNVALKTNGMVVAFGWNDYGQTNVPIGLNWVTAIAAGYGHTVALRSDGTVVAWGNNDNSQTNVPVGLSNVMAIAAGGSHTVALMNVVGPPSITTQPLSQTVGVGSNVTFYATAYGAPPLVFQWYCNGTPVGSAVARTNLSSYTLSNVGMGQAGNYNVEVVNGFGSVTSLIAVLTVIGIPPVITAQPVSQQPLLGSGVSFTVGLSGTAPFHYQWRLNSGSILNATNAVYAIAAVATNHNGSYSVVVTNAAGSVTSSNAVLKVIVPPTLALQIWAGYPLLGLNGMLSSNFTVQYLGDLTATNWLNLLSISNLSATPYQFLDPAGSGEPARFYRALMQ